MTFVSKRVKVHKFSNVPQAARVQWGRRYPRRPPGGWQQPHGQDSLPGGDRSDLGCEDDGRGCHGCHQTGQADSACPRGRECQIGQENSRAPTGSGMRSTISLVNRSLKS